MRYLTVNEVLLIYSRVIADSGGTAGLRDIGGLESAVAQPRMTFGGQELYPTVIDKASAMGFSLIQNHSFVDGNKRTGHAAMETFLVLNGYQIIASTDEQVDVILQVAAGEMGREAFTDWLREHVEQRPYVL
ncbi:MAG: type II toxin-antitoxin system death-on-curing family toxin [Anaerolineae bacterium]|nr:type II toxin-antitoxin system death-on-curing family toxin [Anaerolineae bacterium]